VCKVILNLLPSSSTLLVGRQEGHPACKKTERWDAGMAICLERGADLHMAQRMPLDKWPLNGCKVILNLLVALCLRCPLQMPIKWLALECIQHRKFTHKSDVWSYGESKIRYEMLF